jgi:hypothetical protein
MSDFIDYPKRPRRIGYEEARLNARRSLDSEILNDYQEHSSQSLDANPNYSRSVQVQMDGRLHQIFEGRYDKALARTLHIAVKFNERANSTNAQESIVNQPSYAYIATGSGMAGQTAAFRDISQVDSTALVVDLDNGVALNFAANILNVSVRFPIAIPTDQTIIVDPVGDETQQLSTYETVTVIAWVSDIPVTDDQPLTVTETAQIAPAGSFNFVMPPWAKAYRTVGYSNNGSTTNPEPETAITYNISLFSTGAFPKLSPFETNNVKVPVFEFETPQITYATQETSGTETLTPSTLPKGTQCIQITNPSETNYLYVSVIWYLSF